MYFRCPSNNNSYDDYFFCFRAIFSASSFSCPSLIERNISPSMEWLWKLSKTFWGIPQLTNLPTQHNSALKNEIETRLSAAVKTVAKTVEVCACVAHNIQNSWQIIIKFTVLLQITHGSQQCQSLSAMFIYGTKPYLLA